MNRHLHMVPAVLLGWLVAASAARALEYNEIIANGDTVTGLTGTVDFMTFPVLSDGVVAVQAGTNTSDGGIITSTGGAPSVAFGYSTAIPGGTGAFTSFSLPVVSNGHFGFVGSGSSGQLGVYRSTGLSLSLVADKSSTAPGSDTAFTDFSGSSVSIDATGNIAFGGNYSGGSGIYYQGGGAVTSVANTSTIQPGTGLAFTGFAYTAVAGSRVDFFGSSGASGADGYHTWEDGVGTVSALVDTTMTDPLGRSYTAFGTMVTNGADRAFVADVDTGSGLSRGLYRMMDSTTELILELGDMLGGVEVDSIDPSISINENGDLAFGVTDASANPSIFAYIDDEFLLIADTSTDLNGKMPLAGEPSLGIAKNQFSQDEIAFYATTGPGEFGVYTTQVPEPGSTALLGAAIVGALGIRRRRA